MASDWPNYLFRCDFTEFAEVLSQLPLGVADENTQRTIAAALDTAGPVDQRQHWSLTNDVTEYTLFGVEILYNGPNDRDFATLSTFKHCLRMRFPASTTAPVGAVFMCWN